MPTGKLMYSPEFERDACGMGFITQVDGRPSHELVEKALTMLQRMNHRGGTGAEPDTGDGAGILMAMPDQFFRNQMKQAQLTLPPFGDYAVAQLFLPHDEQEQATMLASVQQQMRDAGFPVLLTRSVPFVYESCGPAAQKSMPGFIQVIIQRPVDVAAAGHLKITCTGYGANLRKHLVINHWPSVPSQVAQSSTRGCCTPIKSGSFTPIYTTKACKVRFA